MSPASRRPSARSLVERAIGCAILLAAGAGIAVVRPALAATLHTVKAGFDIYALPPAQAMPAVSLGYRAALADYLFTSVKVQYGMHGEEKRRFEHVADYLDAIVELDPTFREPYKYADTFIIYQPFGSPGPEEVHRARRILDKGLEMLPGDGQLHLGAGQFFAFIATQWVTDEAEKAEYADHGANILTRAGELVTANLNIQHQALAGVALLGKSGKRKAAISALQRMYAVTDDPELQQSILERLNALEDEEEASRARRRADAFDAVWRSDLTFAPRDAMRVIGPPWAPASCAGALRDPKACPMTWSEWGEAREE